MGYKVPIGITCITQALLIQVSKEVNHNKIAKSTNQHRKHFMILTMDTELSFMYRLVLTSTKDRTSKRQKTRTKLER